MGQPVLSRRHPRLDGQGQRRSARRDGARPRLLPRHRRDAAPPGPTPGRRCVVGFVLLRLIAEEAVMDWQALVFLGAYHGINPGMGWLFAVALGLQQGRARGVWRALPPIAVGHALSVGSVLVTVGLAQFVVPPATLTVLVAGLLISMGLYRLWRHRHPRFGGMQVGFRDLTVWSFLMASAHG